MFKVKESLKETLIIIILMSILIITLPTELIKVAALLTLIISIIYLLRVYIGNRLYSTLNHYLKIKNNEEAIICAIKHDNIFNLRKNRLLSKIALAQAYYNLTDFQKAYITLEKIELTEYDSKYIKSLYCYKVAELNCLLTKDNDITSFYDEYEKEILDLRKYLILKKEKEEYDNTLLFIITYIKIVNKNKQVATSILKDLEDDWNTLEINKRNYKILQSKLKKLK